MSFFTAQYYSIYTWFFFFWETLNIVFATSKWHEGRRKWQPTPVLLSGKSHGQRSLVGYSPWGHEESDTTAWLHFHFSLSCIGEGNGNPLQYSHLENPRDRGAWWAAVYGVAQSQTRLKWLSSSSMTWREKKKKKQMRGKVGNGETIPNKRDLKAIMCP